MIEGQFHDVAVDNANEGANRGISVLLISLSELVEICLQEQKESPFRSVLNVLEMCEDTILIK